jgi:hypothetical protein
MREQRPQGASSLTDPVLALTVYWLRADVMHTLVHATMDAWREDPTAHKTEFDTYTSFWLSALYVVVEGFTDLKLDATQVPEMLNPRVQTLKRFRNGCFHYQRSSSKADPFRELDALDWAEQLHNQFRAFFSDYLAKGHFS